MATRSLGSLTLDLVAKTGGFEQGMDRAARSMQRFKADAQKQQDDLEKLLGRIDPVVARLGELDKMEQQLAAHRKANRLPADDYAEYLGKLNAMRDGLTASTDAMGKNAMSAKAQAAALRGLPAQFTDIAVSLQAGQQPLTVLLQQGGQLKDMFGGIGPAARAMGGYIAGLVNPFTLAAAAAAVLALAYKQGSDEQDAFRAAIVSTGNLAGKNTGQLADLANEISNVTGTTGAAADALSQLVATGSLTSDQFKDMAVAAVAWESATGKAVSETVAEFKRLADEPTKASAALNEQYNYLTAAVYEQIRALEEQGNKTAAANLAETTYASALQERAKNIKENLGTIESAWKSVTSGAKAAWDAMLNIGREDTLAQQIEKVQKQLDELPARSSLTGRQASRDQAAQDAQRAALQGQLDFLRQQKTTQDSIARAQGLAAEDERAAIAASTSMHQKYLAGLDNEGKKKNAIAELDRERAARLRVTGADAVAIEREYAVALAKIEDDFKDKKKTPRAKAYSDDEATRTLLALRQQQSSLEEQLSSSEKLTASQQKLAQFEQQIADLKTKQTLTADQKSLLANQDQIKAQLQKNAAIEQEIAQKQELQKLTERAAQLDASIVSSLASQQEQYGRQLDGAGMGDQYRERLNQQKSIYREFQRYQEQLDKATPKDLLGSDQYNEAAEKIRAGQEKALKQSQDYYAELDRQSADWSLGAQDAYQNYLASARDVAGQTKSLFTNAFSSMEDAIVSFAMTGKLSFADFAKSVLADMAKIAVRSASSQALSGLLSVAGQVAASYFGGRNAPTSTTASVGGSSTTFNPQLNTAGLSYNAKGGVYDSPSLSAYSNQVHSTPKLFAFAKGAGVFGEAGPEAIMPLTRAADGSLGVRALSGSQSTLPTAAAPIMIKTDVHVDAGGNATSTTDESQAGDAGKQLGKMISDGALRVVQQQLATGGSIWRLVNGR